MSQLQEESDKLVKEMDTMLANMKQFKFAPKDQLLEVASEEESSRQSHEQAPEVPAAKFHSLEEDDLSYSQSVIGIVTEGKGSTMNRSLNYKLVEEEDAGVTAAKAQEASPEEQSCLTEVNRKIKSQVSLPQEQGVMLTVPRSVDRTIDRIINQRKNIFQISDDPEAKLRALHLIKRLHEQKAAIKQRAERQMRLLDERVLKHSEEMRFRRWEREQKKKIQQKIKILDRIERQKERREEHAQLQERCRKFVVKLDYEVKQSAADSRKPTPLALLQSPVWRKRSPVA